MFRIFPLLKVLLRIDTRLASLNAMAETLLDAHQPMPAAPTEQCIGDQEVMDILGISYSSLRRFRDEGKIPYSRFGRRYYYRRSDIHALLQTRRRS